MQYVVDVETHPRDRVTLIVIISEVRGIANVVNMPILFQLRLRNANNIVLSIQSAQSKVCLSLPYVQGSRESFLSR